VWRSDFTMLSHGGIRMGVGKEINKRKTMAWPQDEGKVKIKKENTAINVQNTHNSVEKEC